MAAISKLLELNFGKPLLSIQGSYGVCIIEFSVYEADGARRHVFNLMAGHGDLSDQQAFRLVSFSHIYTYRYYY